jgi:hypothetical protein
LLNFSSPATAVPLLFISHPTGLDEYIYIAQNLP